MFEKILIFIVFLGPLIFFHELGHFFFARLFGVRVEVFSIGFGPKLFKIVRNDTQYAISAIPLGGYVKMFGDDPFSETPLTDEEKKVAFNHKSKWARFWIVFGGPLANLLLAYFLYVGLLAGGEKVPETKVGVVAEKTILFDKGLRTGDVLVKINDEKILSFDDFNINSSTVDTITVRRGEKLVELSPSMELEPFIKEFVGMVSAVKRPIVVDAKGEQYYLSIAQKPIDLSLSMDELAASFSGVAYLYTFDEVNVDYTLNHSSEKKIEASEGQTLAQLIADQGLYPVDLSVRSVVPNSPASKIGIQKGDVLIKLEGKSLSNFEELRSGLQILEDGIPAKLTFISKGQQFEKEIVPDVKEIEGKKTKLVGIESQVHYIAPKLITVKEENFGAAAVNAFGRTWDGIVKTFLGYKKLLTREVSLNNIGGPLAIGKVASDSFNISLSMFFRLMALISINLGVINLFPIPVLDGGHIMFLIFETINGGPLSRRKLEIAQRLGVSVLFLLIFVALFNDITRLF